MSGRKKSVKEQAGNDAAATIDRIKKIESHLEKLRQKEYCDVTLKTGSKLSEPVYGHKIILYAASPYFADLLVSGELNQHYEIVVDEVERSALDFLLRCIYNCHVDLTESSANVFEICIGAKLLQLSWIQEACEKSIEGTRTVANCLDIWSFGVKQGSAKLSDPEFILKHFGAVSKTDRFTSLTNEEITTLLSVPLTKPMAIPTNDLLLSLHNWVKSKVGDGGEGENKSIETFLGLVKKLPQDELNQQIFASVFLEDNRLMEHDDCKKYREDYLCEFFKRQIYSQKSDGPSTPTAVTTPSKRSVKVSPVVQNGSKSVKTEIIDDDDEAVEVVIPTRVKKGRGRPKLIKTDVETSQPSSARSDRSRSTSAPSVKRSKKSDSQVVPFGDAADGSQCMAYFILHKGKDWIINSCNFQTGICRPVGNFLHFRENGVMVMANNLIYYLGGKTSFGGPGVDGEDSNQIDVLDLTTREWNSSGDILELEEGRCYFNCAVLNNNIYVTGGYRQEDGCIDSVERIYIGPAAGKRSAEEEEEVTNIEHPKNRSPLAVLRGNLYSVGGVVAEKNKNAFASTFVERYDPATNKWSRVTRMNTARVGHSVAVLNDKLYAIGGGKSEEALDFLKLNTVEVYDPETDKWEDCAPMHKKRHFSSAVAFDSKIYVFGGDSKTKPTAERYNPEEDLWEMVQVGLPNEADFSSIIFQVLVDPKTEEATT